MKNRDIYYRDPVISKLLNDGVAEVSEGISAKELQTLRYELEHFVCEGQYKEGLIRILKSFIDNADSTVQPAAWVSGFFGSGKSHLLKMVRHLWVDTQFPDGATARGLVPLPTEVKELLMELNTLGKRCGGLDAASGKLPSGGAGSVRLTVLGILFRSKGLPESLPQARFCLWLKKNEIYETVRRLVEDEGRDFLSELGDLYVSPILARALLAADQTFAPDEKQARVTLRQQYPVVDDITTTEFVSLIREVLFVNGQLPCTLIVLDEVQLFIGESSERSTDVQEVAEALCKQLDSRVLLVGSGQTALAGSLPNLQRLRGRFTIPVELSDADVETVTRRVVLAKKADKCKLVQERLDSYAGEIDRQLAGTTLAARSEDREFLVIDYPLLPVRRRFWEQVLRAVDVPGTTAQLRTQLRIVYEAARETAEEPLGFVVPADFIFGQLQPDLVRTGVLLREIDETIRKLDDGSEDGLLARRLCSLIFLIRKLPQTTGGDSGVRPTPEMLADLMVRDLDRDGQVLRQKIPPILDTLASAGKIIKLDDGYSMQTREGSEWDREFRNRQSKLLNDLVTVGAKRSSLLAAAMNEGIGGIRLLHGKSKEPRRLTLHFGAQPPPAGGRDIPVWVRDGWDEKEGTVEQDARAAGPSSPMIFIFIPRRQADSLKTAIVDCEAARATLGFKGVPSSDGGKEARTAMEARLRDADHRLKEIVGQVAGSSRVFQGGGGERLETDTIDKIKAAAEASLIRLFPNFHDADHERWDSVIKKARSGDDGALKGVGWNDKPEKHPVCSAILSHVGAGKAGKAIRVFFADSPYGWPRDAIDGALILLHTAGLLMAMSGGGSLAVGQLDQAKVPAAEFRVEGKPIETRERIKLRKLFQKLGVACKPNEEQEGAGSFLVKMVALAVQAGGESPLPACPSIVHLDSLRVRAGNEQLVEILAQFDNLEKQMEDWTALAGLAVARKPAWDLLQGLLGHTAGLPETAALKEQVEAVQNDRRLLDSTDPVPMLLKSVAALLRTALNKRHADLTAIHKAKMDQLESSDTWKRIEPGQKERIIQEEGIAAIPSLLVGDDESLLQVLDECPLSAWRTRADALPQRFSRAALAAARLLEPKVQRVHLTSGTLKTPEEVKHWVVKTERDMLKKIKDGPVVVG